MEGEDWKHILSDAFTKVKAGLGGPLKQGGRIVPRLDRTGNMQLAIQPRKFTKKKATDFTEYLYADAAQKEVK